MRDATRHTCTKNTGSVTGLFFKFNGRERTKLLEGAQVRPRLPPPPKAAACPLCRFQFAHPLTSAGLLRHQDSATCIAETAALRERAASRQTARATAANARKPGLSGQPPFPFSSLTNSLTSDLHDAPGGVDFLPPSHDTLASSSVASGSNSSSSNARPTTATRQGFQVGGLSESMFALRNTQFDCRHEGKFAKEAVSLGENCFRLAKEMDLPLQGLQNTPFTRPDTSCVQFPVNFTGVCVPAGYVLPAAQPLFTLRPGILSSTTQSLSNDALRLVGETLRPVVAVFPTGAAVVFMPGCRQQGGCYGSSLCYGHSVASEADVNGLHVMVAALLTQQGSGPKVAIAMVDMRCDLPITRKTRVSAIFFPSAAGGRTDLTVDSWLSMQPPSPPVLALLEALSPAASASGGIVHHPASAAVGAELRSLLSAHLVASSAGAVKYDRVEHDHSVGVSEMIRSWNMLLSHGLGSVTPAAISDSGMSLRLCLTVRRIGHSEKAGCLVNTALNITNTLYTTVVLQQNRDPGGIERDTRHPFWNGPHSKFSIGPLLDNPGFKKANIADMRNGYYNYAAALVEAAAVAQQSKQPHMATYLALFAELAFDQVLRLWYVMDPEAALSIRSTLGPRADPWRHPSLPLRERRVRCSLSVPEKIAPLAVLSIVTPQTSCVELAPKEQFQSQLQQLQMQAVPALPTAHTARPVASPMADAPRICPWHLLGEPMLCVLPAPKNPQPTHSLPAVGLSSPQPPQASAMSPALFNWDEVSPTQATSVGTQTHAHAGAHPPAHEHRHRPTCTQMNIQTHTQTRMFARAHAHAPRAHAGGGG